MAASSSAPAAAAADVPAGFDQFILPRMVDDMHLHVRDGAAMESALAAMLRGGGGVRRAILMPNLQPPVTDARAAREYRARVMDAVRRSEQRQRTEGGDPTASIDFEPLMTLYLTDHTTPQHIHDAKASGIVYACKLYPRGATTHSNQGVTDVRGLLPTLQAMADAGLLLLVHGEVTDPGVDVFDRERVFLPQVEWVLHSVPKLRVVLEHATTADAVQLLRRHAESGRLAATVTPQHLLHDRNALFEGGLNPHLYCLPILKTHADRRALLDALLDPTLGRSIFCGTDSAPHPRSNKTRDAGCAAGCFSAYASIELYAQAIVPACIEAGFTAERTQQLLEDFFTSNAARFYQLPLNPPREVRLRRKPWTAPLTMPFGDDVVVPLRAGKTLDWSVEVAPASAPAPAAAATSPPESAHASESQ